MISNALLMACALVIFALGVVLGWNIGNAESRTDTAKLGVIITVQEIQ